MLDFKFFQKKKWKVDAEGKMWCGLTCDININLYIALESFENWSIFSYTVAWT